jgi:hypothetical protein
MSPCTNFKRPSVEEEIIDISSDSEVERTPTKPRTNRPLPLNRNTSNAVRPAISPFCSVSTALSTTLGRVTLTDTTTVGAVQAGQAEITVSRCDLYPIDSGGND